MRWKCARENWILVYFLLAAVKFLCWNVALRMSVQNNLPYFQGCTIFTVSLSPVRQGLSGYSAVQWTELHLTQRMPKGWWRPPVRAQLAWLTVAHMGSQDRLVRGLTAMRVFSHRGRLLDCKLLEVTGGNNSFLVASLIFSVFHLCEILYRWRWNTTNYLLTLVLWELRIPQKR